jgi:hypothetical protein
MVHICYFHECTIAKENESNRLSTIFLYILMETPKTSKYRCERSIAPGTGSSAFSRFCCLTTSDQKPKYKLISRFHSVLMKTEKVRSPVFWWYKTHARRTL